MFFIFERFIRSKYININFLTLGRRDNGEKEVEWNDTWLFSLEIFTDILVSLRGEHSRNFSLSQHYLLR